MTDPPQTVLAYDKTLLEKGEGTNVVFNDFHVSFEKPDILEKLGILPAKEIIDINAKFLIYPADANEAKSILISKKIDEVIQKDNNLTSSLLTEKEADKFTESFLEIEDVNILSAPRVKVLSGQDARIMIATEIAYISGYTEPNNLSEEPKPVIGYVEDQSILVDVRPEVSSDKQEDILLEIEYVYSVVEGFEKMMYDRGYEYEIPTISTQTVSTKALINDGKTLFLAPRRIKTKMEDGQIVEKNLLILVKAEIVRESS
jgi:hypothetical protein